MFFEIDNFLDEEEFDKLYKSFPDDELFNYSNKDNDRHDKIQIDLSDEQGKKFYNHNEHYKKLIDIFRSQKFYNEAYKFTLKANLKSRGIKFLKKWKTNLDGNYFKKIFRKIETQINFNLQKKSQLLYPHTDFGLKVLSMIYYISNNSREGGTEFWHIKKNLNYWSNWKNRSISDKDELNKFLEDAKLVHKSIFKPNKLVGFVKNSYSYHSVNVYNKNLNLDRKTLNIFLRVPNLNKKNFNKI